MGKNKIMPLGARSTPRLGFGIERAPEAGSNDRSWVDQALERLGCEFVE
jgi:hypothetical protein